MKKFLVGVTCAGLALSGCSTASKDIAASYVSPMQYNTYDCDQITAENARLNSKVTQLGGRLDEAASNDKAITGVGIVLFWPALFALGGTKQQEAEYAKLKGEHDALQQAAIQKKCNLGTPTLEAKKPDEAAASKVAEVQPAPAPVTPQAAEAAPAPAAEIAKQ